MEYSFTFHGGVYKPTGGKIYKFLLFVVTGGEEISLKMALSYELVRIIEQTSPVGAASVGYETSCEVIKLLVHEMEFGKPKFFCPLYLHLGQNLDGRDIEITPRAKEAKGAGWHFQASARFLKRSEVMSLFAPTHISYKILEKWSLPPVPILKEFIKIIKPKAVQKDEAVRRLRIRETAGISKEKK